MSIQRADIKDIESILFVINKSNSEAYRGIIPSEHFKDPDLILEKLSKEFEYMIFYTYKLENKLVGVAVLRVESNEVGCVRWVQVLLNT